MEKQESVQQEFSVDWINHGKTYEGLGSDLK